LGNACTTPEGLRTVTDAGYGPRKKRGREGPTPRGAEGGDTATPAGTFRAGAMGAGRGRGGVACGEGRGENVRDRERGRHRRLIRGHTEILPRR